MINWLFGLYNFQKNEMSFFVVSKPKDFHFNVI